jgi:diguanylate cyclase (GGDEF)-like protein
MDILKKILRTPEKNDKNEKISINEDKTSRLQATLASYKAEIANVNDIRIERDIYQSMLGILSLDCSFDELLHNCVNELCRLYDARYGAVFFVDHTRKWFTYHIGKGYDAARIEEISYTYSLMGQSLSSHEIIWEPDLRKLNNKCISLNQDPPEYAVLLLPLTVSGEDIGVLRIANGDKEKISSTLKIIKKLLPTIQSQLERVQLLYERKRALNALNVSFSIARLLENTLVEEDIIRKLCARIPNLIPCKGCLIVYTVNDGLMKPYVCWPQKFSLGGNSQSQEIYIRNLLGAFPEGSVLIKDIHRDRRWAWPVQDVMSLAAAPLLISQKVKGLIISVGPYSQPYDKTVATFLELAAAQASVTLERASYFRRQEELASTDGLTGLYNHRVFQENLRSEIDRSKRYKRSLSLIMFDIDHFKKFNDTYGHPVGDEVIKMVARMAKESVRATDRVYRYGGEEFCIVMPEAHAGNAAILADRMRSKIEADKSVQGLSVTISLGIAEYVANEKPEAFLERTDDGLYKSKENGRNCFTVV